MPPGGARQRLPACPPPPAWLADRAPIPASPRLPRPSFPQWHPKINQILVGCGDRKSGAARVLYDPAYSTRGVLLATGRKPRPANPFDFEASEQVHRLLLARACVGSTEPSGSSPQPPAWHPGAALTHARQRRRLQAALTLPPRIARRVTSHRCPSQANAKIYNPNALPLFREDWPGGKKRKHDPDVVIRPEPGSQLAGQPAGYTGVCLSDRPLVCGRDCVRASTWARLLLRPARGLLRGAARAGKGAQGKLGSTGGTLLTQYVLKNQGKLRKPADDDARGAILRHAGEPACCGAASLPGRPLRCGQARRGKHGGGRAPRGSCALRCPEGWHPCRRAGCPCAHPSCAPCAGKDADEFSVFTAAYRETQPTPIFAEPDEEEEDEEEGDGIRKYVPR